MNMTSSLYSRHAFSSIGISARHGGQAPAQKLSTTGRYSLAMKSSKFITSAPISSAPLYRYKSKSPFLYVVSSDLQLIVITKVAITKKLVNKSRDRSFFIYSFSTVQVHLSLDSKHFGLSVEFYAWLNRQFGF